MTGKISMSVNDTLELDYLVEQIDDNTITIASEPNNVSTSVDCVNKRYGVFNPPETGKYQIDINGQIVEVDVFNLPNNNGEIYKDGELEEYWQIAYQEGPVTEQAKKSDHLFIDIPGDESSYGVGWETNKRISVSDYNTMEFTAIFTRQVGENSSNPFNKLTVGLGDIFGNNSFVVSEIWSDVDWTSKTTKQVDVSSASGELIPRFQIRDRNSNIYHHAQEIQMYEIQFY